MTIFGSRNMSPVVEKYVGTISNRKEFDVIEKEMAEIVKYINESHRALTDRIMTGDVIGGVTISANKLNTGDSNIKIEQMFKKIFGVKEFCLTWMTDSNPGAFTLPKTYQILDRNYKRAANGQHSNSKLFVGVVMHTGLVTQCNLNEKELIAIILHEIGHNFYPSIFNILSGISLQIPVDLMGPTMMQQITMNLAQAGARDILSMNVILYKLLFRVPMYITKEFPALERAGAIAKEIYNEGSSLVNTFIRVKNLIDVFKGLRRFIVKPFSILFLYNEEKHSDSFATDYGYGQYIASGLAKMRLQERSVKAKIIYNTPGLNWITDFMDVQFELIGRCFSGYPSEQNRARTQLDRLKRSAKDESLDPRVRKELEKQIEDFENYYNNEYLSISTDQNKKRIFTWAYMNIVEKVFRGKADIREIVYAFDPEKYN